MYSYKYPRLAITVDALVYVSCNNSYYLLLIKRGQEPYKGRWALPGGFVNMDELLEIACIRELYEETGLVVNRMKQFKVFDEINRDPRGRTISVVYSSTIPEITEVKGGDDAKEAKWFSIDELPDLAFDHEKIIKDFFKN